MEFFGPDRERIGTATEEHGVAERDVPGQAREGVPRRGGDHEDEREERDRGRRRVREHERKGDEGSDDGDDRHGCHTTSEGLRQAHCARAAAFPKSPTGRIVRTRTSTAKNTSCDQIGDQATATTSSSTSMKMAATSAPPIEPRPPRMTIVSRREIRS